MQAGEGVHRRSDRIGAGVDEVMDRPCLTHVFDQQGIPTLRGTEVLHRVARNPTLHRYGKRLDESDRAGTGLTMRPGS